MQDIDFEIVDRQAEDFSVKYWMAKHDKQNVDTAKMIVCGMADMEFKFAPELRKKLEEDMNKPWGYPHFGYCKLPPSVRQSIVNWFQDEYKLKVQEKWILDWPNLFSIYFGVLMTMTQEQDLILFLTPSYYRLILTAHFWKRKSIESRLIIKDNNFYFDFEDIDKKLTENKIKMIVIVNPQNPCGRVWSREELQKIKDLAIKHDILVYSDEIYGLSVQDNFTSMLAFEDIRDRCVIGISHTKTYNCSGMGIGYSLTANEDFSKKFDQFKYFSGNWPTLATYRLTQVCLRHGKPWRRKSIQYIQSNYKYFKELCQQFLPKLIIFDLQSTFLVLVDFKNYCKEGAQVKQKIHEQQVYPSYIDDWYVEWYEHKTQRTFVRINIACNRSILPELVGRLAKAFPKPLE